MKTPIYDFIKKYSKQSAMRLHMPGHKGNSFLGIEHMDITEISGADVLYSATGIIDESQKIASQLFNSGITLYSCEGSSLSIRAMLYLTMLANDKKEKQATILACRNVHKVFMSAAALLNFNIEWLYSEKSNDVISCEINAELLEKKLLSMKELPVAFYITSPDYLGNIADIEKLSAVCRRYGVLLLCDNAHGAYLHFLPTPKHPLDLGADMCCDSAHKTLPALTGGAYLHISKLAPTLLMENAKRAMALFASTSPSYLILQSLDMANQYLADGYSAKLLKYIKYLDTLKQKLTSHGFDIIGNEPLKLTLAPKSYGYTGNEIADYLLEKNIVCEFSDCDYIVFMITPENDISELNLLEKELLGLQKKDAILSSCPKIHMPKIAITAREAMFSKGKVLPVEQCEGKILVSESISCPPAVPIITCGEIIDSAAIKVLKYYGIKTCRVIDDNDKNGAS